MSKGLEALKYLDEHNLNWHDNPTKKRVDIIEKELKRLEEIDDILNTGGGIWAENGIVSKDLKAFEIIKEKKVDMYRLSFCDCVGKYNARCKKTQSFLSQEEFDLLKGVLL